MQFFLGMEGVGVWEVESGRVEFDPSRSSLRAELEVGKGARGTSSEGTHLKDHIALRATVLESTSEAFEDPLFEAIVKDVPQVREWLNGG